MPQKQLNKFTVITRLIDGTIAVRDAALCLGLYERQVKRLKKGVMHYGAAFLIHKNSIRKSKHAFSSGLLQKIVEPKSSELYKNSNFSNFRELIKKYEDITISYCARCSILKKHGI